MTSIFLRICPWNFNHPPTKLRQGNVFSRVHQSVILSMGHITHDALDLTVQTLNPGHLGLPVLAQATIPPPLTSDLGPLPSAPVPAPNASDIWWWLLENCSNLFIWTPPPSNIWWWPVKLKHVRFPCRRCASFWNAFLCYIGLLISQVIMLWPSAWTVCLFSFYCTTRTLLNDWYMMMH